MIKLETLWHFILAGGPIMIPLAGISLIMWIMIFLKLEWLMGARNNGMTIENGADCLQSGRLPCADHSDPKTRALHSFMTGRCFCRPSDFLLWQAAVKRQQPLITKYMDGIIVMAAVAPLLGLMGTVTGMIKTFDVIGFQGMGNAQAMASGIREALITTQAGLLVAIPGLVAGQYLKKSIRSIRQELSIFEQAIHQYLERSV